MSTKDWVNCICHFILCTVFVVSGVMLRLFLRKTIELLTPWTAEEVQNALGDDSFAYLSFGEWVIGTFFLFVGGLLVYLGRHCWLTWRIALAALVTFARLMLDAEQRNASLTYSTRAFLGNHIDDARGPSAVLAGFLFVVCVVGLFTCEDPGTLEIVTAAQIAQERADATAEAERKKKKKN